MTPWSYAGLSALGATSTPTPIVDVAMPGSVQNEIATVATAFKSLDRTIDGRKAQLPADFLAGWKDFNAEWQTFAAAHSSWLSNTWYKSYQKVLEYRRRLEDWRGQLEGLSGKKVDFPNPGPGQAPAGLPSMGIPWKTLIYVGLGIAGVFGLARLANSAGELKREFSGPRPVPETLVNNPPVWALDPEIWESARLAVEPHAETYDNPEAVKIHVYKQMGGRAA